MFIKKFTLTHYAPSSAIFTSPLDMHALTDILTQETLKYVALSQ